MEKTLAVYASCAGGSSRAKLQEVSFHFQPALDAMRLQQRTNYLNNCTGLFGKHQFKHELHLTFEWVEWDEGGEGNVGMLVSE